MAVCKKSSNLSFPENELQILQIFSGSDNNQLMTTANSQDFLFQRIKDLIPQDISMVDAISEILNISSDSAYRRIRGETQLVLEEAKLLCDHFHLLLDQMLDIKSGTILFRNVRIDLETYKYERYLADILQQLQHVGSFSQKEIIYLTKDVPLFHNFYYQPFIAFRYFFWMKTLIQHPDFAGKGVELNSVPPEIEKLSRQLTVEYTKIPSTEIWNTECINAAIIQVEFYKDSGYFSSSADIKTVYEALEETLHHLKNQAEYGCKFMPGENPQIQKSNFKFFYNRVALGDNKIMVVTDNVKTVFLNYDVLNYVTTKDAAFCDPCYRDLQNLMKRSTLISQTSEKQRNIFFNIMLTKIKDRKRNL